MEKTDKWKKMINQYRDAAYDGDESEKYPYLNKLKKSKFEVLQTSGGYITNAVKVGILQQKHDYNDIKNISQKWHYFVSYIYMYQELGIGRGKKTADLQNEKDIGEKITQLKNLVKKENTTKQNQEEQIKYVLNQIDENNVNMNNWNEPGDIKCSELLIWMWEVGKSEDNNDINELISIIEIDAHHKKLKTAKITNVNKIIKDNLCPDNL